jgi:hypothetical protein
MRGVWLGPPLSEGLSLGEDQERLAAYTVEPHRLDSRLRLHNSSKAAMSGTPTISPGAGDE